MRKLVRRRPSPAFVLAFVALLVALSGTAAARLIITGHNVRNGSLTGADIRNGSLTYRDVRRNTLTGRQIAENRLGTVPRARSAGVALAAGNANSVGGLTARKVVFHAAAGTDDTAILGMAGLTLIGSCSGGKVGLRATTTVNNSDLRVTVIRGQGDIGVRSTTNFDIGNSIDATAGKAGGTGTLIYDRADGPVVTVTYRFHGSPSFGGAKDCIVSGTAFGG